LQLNFRTGLPASALGAAALDHTSFDCGRCLERADIDEAGFDAERADKTGGLRSVSVSPLSTSMGSLVSAGRAAAPSPTQGTTRRMPRPAGRLRSRSRNTRSPTGPNTLGTLPSAAARRVPRPPTRIAASIAARSVAGSSDMSAAGYFKSSPPSPGDGRPATRRLGAGWRPRRDSNPCYRRERAMS
jgi:hypothetical protein